MRQQELQPTDAEALADFTLRLIGATSPSGQEGAAAQLAAAEMRRLGFAVERDEAGNVLGTIGGESGPTVLIDAHLDTVGVTEPEAWSHAPTGERVGGRIYGRGSMDMKGPLAAAIYGIAVLAGRLPRGRVVVSATVAEELVEGPATEIVARRLRPDFVIIGEATSLKLARGQRGRAEIVVTTHGRPTHSSRPELGVNAAEAMVDVVTTLRELAPPEHSVLGQGILVLTDILSQPYPGLSVVPDRCLATFDRRTLPGETEESVLAPVRAAVATALEGSEATGEAAIARDRFETYTGYTIDAPNFAPAWFYPDDAPVVHAAARGLAAAGIAPELSHYAFCTNGSGTAGRLGIPTIGFGPGDEERAHRVDEYIEVADLARGASGYAAIARALLEEG